MKTYKKILSYLLIVTIGLGVIFGVLPMMAFADDDSDISWAVAYMSDITTITPEYVDENTTVNVKNILEKMINDEAIIAQIGTGFTVTILNSDDESVVESNGTVIFNTDPLRSCIIDYEIHKDTGDPLPGSIEVFVSKALFEAKAFIQGQEPIEAVFGSDINIVTKINDMISDLYPGITATIFYSSPVGTIDYATGNITYGPVEKNINVSMNLRIGDANVPISFSVIVPTFSDEEVISYTQSIFGDLGDFHYLSGQNGPIQGRDKNILPVMQRYVNTFATGVVVTLNSSSNANVVAETGAIVYGDTEEMVNVNFILSKGNSSDSATMTTTVPAKASTDGEKLAVIDTAISWRSINEDFNAIYGKDTNAKAMILDEVNYWLPEITDYSFMESFSSSNPAIISNAGVINYDDTQHDVDVNFAIKYGALQAIPLNAIRIVVGDTKSTAPTLSNMTVINNGGPNDIFQIRNLDIGTVVKVYYDVNKQNLIHTFGPVDYQVGSWTVYTDFGIDDLPGSLYVTLTTNGKLESEATEITYTVPSGTSAALNVSHIQSIDTIIENYQGGIIVKNITGGDLIKVYDAETDGNLLFKEILMPLSTVIGDKEVKLTTLPPNKKVYVSITRKGKFESDRTEFTITNSAITAAFSEIASGFTSSPPIDLVKGTDTNAITKLQSVIDTIKPNSGVTIKQIIPSTPADALNVAANGDITYDEAGLVNVDVILTINSFDSGPIPIVFNLPEDKQGKIIAAKAELAAKDFSDLHQESHVDDNILIIAQALVNTRVSNVVVTIVSSNNSRINPVNGHITYGAECSGSVTFKVKIDSFEDVIEVPLIVPEICFTDPVDISLVNSNNLLLIGDYAFNLDLDPAVSGYNYENFMRAKETIYKDPNPPYTTHVYYRLNGIWYDIIADPTMSTPIADQASMNGAGKFKFLNMNAMGAY